MTSIRLKIAMMAVLVLAAALRLRHIDFGLPALNDPDELMFEMGAIRMLRTGTLNPGWFGHPATTTMYVLALVDLIVFGVGYVTGHFASPTAFADAVFADPTLVILPGRIVMAAFGVLSVWLTMRLADELLDRKVALGAGLVLAVSPLAVTWAQVIRSDIMATSFLLACLIATARHAREPSNSRFVWAAVWLALAVATKWPFALGALPMIAVLLNRWSKGEASFRESLARVAAFGALTLALLLLISPYLVLDHETLWRNLQGEAQAHHLGATGGSPWQNLVWYGQGPVLNGLGLSGSLLAIWGLWLIARHGLRQEYCCRCCWALSWYLRLSIWCGTAGPCRCCLSWQLPSVLRQAGLQAGSLRLDSGPKDWLFPSFLQGSPLHWPQPHSIAPRRGPRIRAKPHLPGHWATFPPAPRCLSNSLPSICRPHHGASCFRWAMRVAWTPKPCLRARSITPQSRPHGDQEPSSITAHLPLNAPVPARPIMRSLPSMIATQPKAIASPANCECTRRSCNRDRSGSCFARKKMRQEADRSSALLASK